MAQLPASIKARAREAAKSLGGGLIGAATVGMLRTTRYFDPVKTSDFFARATRLIGPRLREHRIGRANLTAAFPEKSPEEIEQILMGVWDNLGRVGAEFAHLDRVWDFDEAHPELGRIEVPPRSLELFHQLRLDGKPALIFASHLGNWELPAVAAVAHGLNATILYRRPNSASADRIIQEIRAVKMGTLVPAGRDAPFKLADALQRGEHVAMLVDQYWTGGDPVGNLENWTKNATEHPGSWWPDWIDWIKGLDSETVPAREPGGGALTFGGDFSGPFLPLRR